MLETEAKEVGIESESVFVVWIELELKLGVGKGGVNVDEDEGEGGRKVMLELDFDAKDDEELLDVALKTGGQGGKVGEEKMDVEDEGENELADDDAVNLMLDLELAELLLEAAGILKVKLEGKSNVMDDGMSGTDVEYDG